jgi:hypothetical protein
MIEQAAREFEMGDAELHSQLIEEFIGTQAPNWLADGLPKGVPTKEQKSCGIRQ